MQAQQLRTQLSPVEKSICSAALCLYGAVLEDATCLSVFRLRLLTNATELIINTSRIIQPPGASAGWTHRVWPPCVRAEPRGCLPAV